MPRSASSAATSGSPRSVAGSSASTATVVIAPEVEQSSVEVVIDMASVNSGDATRDDHLRSADFFDVSVHPTATYRSTGLTVDGDRARMEGELTIKGVDSAGHARRRVARRRHRPLGKRATRAQRPRPDQSRGLGSDLERRARSGRAAGVEGDHARDRGRADPRPEAVPHWATRNSVDPIPPASYDPEKVCTREDSECRTCRRVRSSAMTANGGGTPSTNSGSRSRVAAEAAVTPAAAASRARPPSTSTTTGC